MSKKLQKFEDNRQAAEENINQTLQREWTEKEKELSLVRIGAVGAIGGLAKNLSAQTIRALQEVRENKDYESLGFSRFDDYLNESPYSPMSYRQFYDREQLLKKEGDEAFNLLNSLNISHRQRRLLGAGHIEVDDRSGKVIVNHFDSDESEEIELNDRNRLLQTLSALADQAAVLNQKTKKQKEIIERGETELEKLRKELDEAQTKPGKISVFEMFMRVAAAIDNLAAIVKSEPDPQNEVYMRTINVSIGRLEDALEAKSKSAKQPKKTDKFEEVASSLDDEELAGLMD